MKIKSILAGIAAAGTICAVSATAFADDVPLLISANPNSDDIMVISPAPQKSAVDEYLDIYGSKFDKKFNEAKEMMASVGGADAFFEITKQSFASFSSEDVKKMMSEMLKSQGVSEDELNEALEALDSSAQLVFDEAEFEKLKPTFKMIEKCDTSADFVDYLKTSFDDEYAVGIMSSIDQMGNYSDSIDTTDIAKGGDNADTGAEGVAAVVGVITIAGAVVVISRKKAN